MEIIEQQALSYRTTLLGEDISFCARIMRFSQHGGKPVTIATRRIFGGTDSVRGQRGQSGRVNSHAGKIREQKGRQGDNVKHGQREDEGDIRR